MNSHSEQMIDRMNLDKEIEQAAKNYGKDKGDGMDYIIARNGFVKGANYVLNNCKLYDKAKVITLIESALLDFHRLYEEQDEADGYVKIDQIQFNEWIHNNL